MESKDNKQKPNPDAPSAEGTQTDAVEKSYFFHPMKLADESGETLDEAEIEKSKVEIEQKLQELLKSISEETLQLSEFFMEESNLVTELCTSLKQILKKLNVSFNIPPQDMPLRTKVKKAILNDEGHLILVHEKGEVTSAFLAEYPPEIVMAALWDVMPELARVITLYRKKISTRVSFFGKVKKELKGVAKAMTGSKEETAASGEDTTMDVVKETLKPEGQT